MVFQVDFTLNSDVAELLSDALKFAYGQALQDECRGVPSAWSDKTVQLYGAWCDVAEAVRQATPSRREVDF